jgi:pentose-5-phosphate-3-epimerase
MFVAGSAIFGAGDYQSTISGMRAAFAGPKLAASS